MRFVGVISYGNNWLSYIFVFALYNYIRYNNYYNYHNHAIQCLRPSY